MMNKHHKGGFHDVGVCYDRSAVDNTKPDLFERLNTAGDTLYGTSRESNALYREKKYYCGLIPRKNKLIPTVFREQRFV